MFDAKQVKDDMVRWVRDWFEQNGKTAIAVVGISGGKDSSVAAAVCAQALGPNRVFGVMMPQGGQHDIAVSHEVVGFLNIPHCVIQIDKSVQSVLDSILQTGIELNTAARVNTPARIRMTTLYAVAAAKNGRVVNTCNLSEDYVGYSTKFGDAAGDFSPLSKLTVQEVKAVGRALGLPEHFVEKVPEDGLTGKSDEENLGFSYAVLDRYIRTGICKDAATKERIDYLHQTNLHKLRPMPCYEYEPNKN